jgi:hypothetical protein
MWIPGVKRQNQCDAKLVEDAVVANVKKTAAGKSKKEENTSSKIESVEEVVENAESVLEESTACSKGTKRAREEHEDDIAVREAIKKRKELLLNDLVDEDDEKYTSKLQMPYVLKKQLVDEWSVVTKEPRRLLKLPKPLTRTVSAVLKDFLESKQKSLRNSPEQFVLYEELFHGLRVQFNKALPSILLYRQERDQYTRICEQFPKLADFPAELYGCEHLLRFYGGYIMCA